MGNVKKWQDISWALQRGLWLRKSERGAQPHGAERSLAPGELGSGAGSWRGAQGGGRKSQGLLAEQTVLRGLCQAAFVLLTRGRQGKELQRWVEEVHLPHGAPCAVCSGGAVLGPACIFESLLTFFIETSTNPGGILETVAKALSVWHQHARYSALLRRCPGDPAESGAARVLFWRRSSRQRSGRVRDQLRVWGSEVGAHLWFELKSSRASQSS